MANDYELLEQWRAGDPDAGHTLLSRHFSALLRFFYGKVGSEAEDLVQTTLLLSVEAKGRFEHRCSFRTFLFAIARNVLLRHYRAKTTAKDIDPSVSSLHDLGTSPSGAIARSEHSALLLDAMTRIPLDFQLALELHYWEGLAPREIAVVLDLEPATARTRLHRGRSALRKRLEELGAAPAKCRSVLEEAFGRDPADDEGT